MSKYGSGASMKQVMLNEMDEVLEALDRAVIADEDREIVTGALKEAFYQWAMCNATACAFEEYVREADKWLYVRAATARSMAAVMRKMEETYPDWDEEDEEDFDE